MLAIPKELVDLKHISPQDGALFGAAATQSGQVSWLYYFPFLCLFAQSPRQTLLWEICDGAICLYHLVKSREDDSLSLKLYLPPFPQDNAALQHAMGRCRDFNRRRSAVILWADERQRPWVEGRGFQTTFKEEEFIYDGALVRAAEGKTFERMRRMANKARRLPGLEIRAIRPEDQAPCVELLSRWKTMKREREQPYIRSPYMRLSAEQAFAFGDIMQGEVVTVDGRVCAFTFGGRISASHASIFVTISDHDIPALGTLQRSHFIGNRPEFANFNDFSDSQQEGLAKVKRSFRPVTMNRLYRARHPGTG